MVVSLDTTFDMTPFIFALLVGRCITYPRDCPDAEGTNY
jgi:hypothetical protein